MSYTISKDVSHCIGAFLFYTNSKKVSCIKAHLKSSTLIVLNFILHLNKRLFLLDEHFQMNVRINETEDVETSKESR
jgi:hypothetical protein